MIQVETCGPVYRWSLSMARARASNSVAAAGPGWLSRVPWCTTRARTEVEHAVRWAEVTCDSTRLDSTPLDSPRLRSTRLGPGREPPPRPHSAQWRRPGFLCFLARPRRGFATWSTPTSLRYTCARTYRPRRIPRALYRISRGPFLLRQALSLSFLQDTSV